MTTSLAIATMGLLSAAASSSGSMVFDGATADLSENIELEINNKIEIELIPINNIDLSTTEEAEIG